MVPQLGKKNANLTIDDQSITQQDDSIPIAIRPNDPHSPLEMDRNSTERNQVYICDEDEIWNPRTAQTVYLDQGYYLNRQYIIYKEWRGSVDDPVLALRPRF